jgi:hypothetical protein
MTLVVGTLENELLKLFDVNNVNFSGYPATAAAACSNWGNAYDVYAKAATDVSTDSVVLANKALFVSTLLAQMPADPTTGTPIAAANAFDAAFAAYWTAATFAIGVPPTSAAVCPSIGGTAIFALEATSIVSVVTPAVLANLLLPIFSDVTTTGTAQIKAQQIAAAFHTATMTAVMVVITGTDTTLPVPLPITNTCTIF